MTHVGYKNISSCLSWRPWILTTCLTTIYADIGKTIIPLSPLHSVNEHWNRRIHFSGTVLIPSPVASGFWVIPSLLSGFSWKRDGRHFSFYIRHNFICEKVALSVWHEPEFGTVPCSQVKKHAAKSTLPEILTATHTPYHLLDFETHWESTAHLDVHSS